MLVLLAVLISAFRLLLPYVEHYRQDFQDYVNNKNQTDFVIGSLGMSWQRSGPTLIANRVTLVDNKNAYVYISNLEVQIDFWATLKAQRLISSNLLLDGAIVSLNEQAWQNQSDDEPNVSENTNDSLDGFKRISDIFLNRINQFSLVNSKVSLKNNLLERNFSINNLRWLNGGDRHQAQGNIIVDELSSNNLQLNIDLNGSSVDDLKGMMYVEANHIDITPWLDSVLAIDNDNTKADIGFTAWMKVNRGNIERIQLSLHDNFISWQENPPTPITSHTAEQTHTPQKYVQHNLALSAGQLLLVKGKGSANFSLFSTPLLLKFNQQDVQEYTVQVNKTDQDFSVYLSSFDLALISQVSPLFISSNDTRELLAGLDISGQANDIYFNKNIDNIQVLADFSNTSTHYSQGIPGVDNMSGSLSFTDKNLHLDVNAEQGNLDFKHHFVAPIPYQSLQAVADFSMADERWQLQINDIALTSNELNLYADISLESSKDTATTIALLASISNGDASKAGHYYPLTVMSDDLVDYLNTGLIGGEIKQAQVLVNGPLADFPFANNTGTFVVDAELEQAEFAFSDEWPAIKNFDANLNFTNNSMLITGRSGDLTGLDVEGVQVAIDDLENDQQLTVDTLIKPSSAVNVAKLMNQSPLKDSVGSVLQQLKINGNINGEFHLNLPLNDTEQALAQGVINFNNNRIALQTPKMNFDKVNGQLLFENERISTKGLSLNWQGLPLTLTVNGQDKENYYDTSIALKGDWKKSTWLKQLSPKLKKYFDGKLELQGDLSLFQHHDGGFSYQFIVDSQLEQLQLKLPAPYNKAVKKSVPLKVEVNGQLEQSIFKASYGKQLSFYGVLAHETSHFTRAHIVLGNEKMLLPMNGFHITTNLAQASVDVWQPLISDIIDTVSSVPEIKAINDKRNSLPLFSTPERIRGTITRLNLLGQNLNNVSFNLLDKTNWWLLQLNAKETRSQIKLYPNWLEQGIDINADFIQLTTTPNNVVDSQQLEPQQLAHKGDSSSLIDDTLFSTIPNINFHCDRCLIDDINLGEVNFSLVRNDENSLKIDNFTAKREQAQLNFSSEWHQSATISSTRINGALSLNNIEYELEQLGYGSIIRDSGGILNFDLNWNGAPHEFDFSRLNGDLNASVDDGYLAEVSDKARIFSVLSLQSIVRKLTLDFRDIFSEGMFYKDIQGDYHIKEGILYTDNTRMNGSAGNLYIRGNTSFINNTLDYKMSYKPNLTSSLPVLAWIATLNPVVFLAGVAIDQVITSQVVSEFNFELTGSVSEPNFKEVNRKSRDVSVGRSKPPEFVDSNDDNKAQQQKNIRKKSFKELKSPRLIEHDKKVDKNDVFNDNKSKEYLNDG